MVMSSDVHSQNTFWQKLVMSEERRRLYPSAPIWNGGYRWFQSHNVIDLQHYRNPVEKQRICQVLLGVRSIDIGRKSIG
jgi:hypothetical protein